MISFWSTAWLIFPAQEVLLEQSPPHLTWQHCSSHSSSTTAWLQSLDTVGFSGNDIDKVDFDEF